jgi:hypothetical protein
MRARKYPDNTGNAEVFRTTQDRLKDIPLLPPNASKDNKVLHRISSSFPMQAFYQLA